MTVTAINSAVIQSSENKMPAACGRRFNDQRSAGFAKLRLFRRMLRRERTPLSAKDCDSASGLQPSATHSSGVASANASCISGCLSDGML